MSKRKPSMQGGTEEPSVVSSLQISAAIWPSDANLADRNYLQPGEGLEQRSGVSPSPVGCVDDQPRRNRPQHFHDLFGHHRDVIRVLIHGQPLGALAPRWKRAE